MVEDDYETNPRDHDESVRTMPEQILLVTSMLRQRIQQTQQEPARSGPPSPFVTSPSPPPPRPKNQFLRSCSMFMPFGGPTAEDDCSFAFGHHGDSATHHATSGALVPPTPSKAAGDDDTSADEPVPFHGTSSWKGMEVATAIAAAASVVLVHCTIATVAAASVAAASVALVQSSR